MNSREFLLGIIVAPPGAASDGTEPLPALGQFHNNVLRTFPQCLAPKHVEVLEARRERDEMVGWKLAGFRRKMHVAVRQEDFRLAYAAWIQDDLAGSRIARAVFEADTKVQVVQRNPYTLATPACVYDLASERHVPAKRLAGLGCKLMLEVP